MVTEWVCTAIVVVALPALLVSVCWPSVTAAAPVEQPEAAAASSQTPHGSEKPPNSDVPHEVPHEVELFRKALAYYNVGRYDDAIDLFERAYLLSRAPELLYNIAQAHRLKGVEGCAAALRFYRSYARVAKIDNAKRRSVAAVIADMERCVRAHPQPPASAPASAPSAPMTRRVEPQANGAAGNSAAQKAAAGADKVKRSGRKTGDTESPTRRWPWIVVSSAGVAAMIGGAVALGWAKARHDGLVAEGCAPACDPNAANPGRTAQTSGWTLLGSGLAITVGGILAWLFADQREQSPSATEQAARRLTVDSGVVRLGAHY